MRAGGIVMVVIIHSMGYCGELYPFHREVIKFLVHTIAVPLFFLVDGYLMVHLYSSKKKFFYDKYLNKNFFRLMVPWIIFTVLYTFIRYLFECGGFLNERLIVGHSIPHIARSMYGSVYAQQMYFLFSLFIVRISIPFLFQVIKLGRFNILIIFCIYLVSYKNVGEVLAPFLRIEGGQDPILHALWGGQFFLFGALLSLYETHLKNIYFWIILISIIIILLLKTLFVFDFGRYIIQYSYLIAYYCAFFILGDKIDFTKVGKNTMGIYLLHVPVLIKVTSIVVNGIVYSGLLSLFLVSSICLIISYNMTKFIGLIPHGKILFGQH